MSLRIHISYDWKPLKSEEVAVSGDLHKTNAVSGEMANPTKVSVPGLDQQVPEDCWESVHVHLVGACGHAW